MVITLFQEYIITLENSPNKRYVSFCLGFDKWAGSGIWMDSPPLLPSMFAFCRTYTPGELFLGKRLWYASRL